MNEQREDYSDERFKELIKNSARQTSTEFVTNLIADLDAHQGRAEQHDDITIVTFLVTG